MRRSTSLAAAALSVLLALTGALSLAPPASSAVVRNDVAAAAATTFTVSSFNVLGSSHTVNGARGRAAGTTRIGYAATLLEQHGVQLAGFQEFQADQLTRFLQIMRGSWQVYPGLQLKKRDSENSVGWRTDRFALVSARTIDIPYFGGRPRAMPLVLLREKSSGLLTYVLNVHNPAYKQYARYRKAATAIEVKLANQIAATGIPLLVTGDMNERAPYFCAMVGGAPMTAARGGTVAGGVCNARRPRAVDWIFGTRGVRWGGYYEDRSALVKATTDHPVIVTDATITSLAFPRARG